MRFRVHLKKHHDKKGETPYRVWKDTGVAVNTVVRYTEKESVESDVLPTTVISLAQYYGVDWRDPAIVEVIDESADTNRHQ